MTAGEALSRFGSEYARHREAEGRAYSGEDLLNLPYLRSGPLARQWSVRARSFDAFVRHLLRPHAARIGRPLKLLDLGAGNGWLSYRVALEGHQAVALDIRDDGVDGLGAAAPFLKLVPGMMRRVTASFDAIPLDSASLDIAVFNASFHYATDARRALEEAARTVRPDGRLAILDTAFYRREADGAAMVAEKKAQGGERFGERADALLALPFIEFLTRERLEAASASLGLDWRRRRIFYPLWYELRPLQAAIRGARRPSRFDLWIGERR
jgi:SAM-dependent methyltransferase